MSKIGVVKAGGANPYKAKSTKDVRIPLPRRLYKRIEQAAQESGCEVTELILSTLETRLPALPANLPPEVSADLQRWSLLDDEALLAIANAFLPSTRQRRYSTLLSKKNSGGLSQREEAEWNIVQEEYLRFSQNKAKAQFLLAQRRKAALSEGGAGLI